MQRQCIYKGTSTDMMKPVVVEPGRTRGEKEILSAKGIQERREGITIVVEVGIGAGMGMGAGEEVVEWLNSMAMIAMMEVLVRGGWWGES